MKLVVSGCKSYLKLFVLKLPLHHAICGPENEKLLFGDNFVSNDVRDVVVEGTLAVLFAVGTHKVIGHWL